MTALATAARDLPRWEPPLKWAGGKRWLVPALRRWWQGNENRRLVEPFAGALSVSLGLGPRRALLNDINEHSINFYRWVQAGLIIETEFQNTSDFYYAARHRFNELIASGRQDSKESAELFYFLNRTGYNGLCRFNRSGFFNVPYGRYKRIKYAADFLHLQRPLADWELTSRNFLELKVESTDLVYADPPYDVDFTSYSSSPFGWDEQQKLAQWLVELDVPAIASNQATQRIVTLYETHGFKVQVLDAPRRISCTGDRTPAPEMIATIRI